MNLWSKARNFVVSCVMAIGGMFRSEKLVELPPAPRSIASSPENRPTRRRKTTRSAPGNPDWPKRERAHRLRRMKAAHDRRCACQSRARDEQAEIGLRTREGRRRQRRRIEILQKNGIL